MAKFKIKGQQPLKGSVEISGAKNAALPLITASLLTDETITLTNVPDILDIEMMLETMEKLGAQVDFEDGKLSINTNQIEFTPITQKYTKKLRASILFLGAMLGRFEKAELAYPGGCIIGKRPIDTHLDAIKEMGGEIKDSGQTIKASIEKTRDDHTIYLKEASVTATENLLMLAASRPGKTTIEFAASEPHIVNLCQLLEKMGAQIEGIGSNKLIVKGQEKLSGGEIEVIPDTIEIGSFVALAAANDSNLTLEKIIPDQIKPILAQMEAMNIDYQLESDKLSLNPPFNVKGANIKTQPWPGFPTDLQPPFTVLATQAQGTTLVHETLFDQRLYYIDELTKMGANIILCDPHRAVVNGPSKLQGANIISPDIRAGMALVIAALIARGQSTIDNIELIERGYQDLESRLKEVGADIKRIKD